MNEPRPERNLLDELAAGAPVRRMRGRLEEALAEPPRAATRPLVRLAWAAAAILAIATFLAVRRQPPAPAVPQPSVQPVIALLAAPSTFDRLRGVHAAADLPAAWPALSRVLIERLERDESVNVRLAALGVLRSRPLSPALSARLTGALVAQETAIVQAHLGHQLRRRHLLSAAALERLLDHSSVRESARDALNRLEDS